MAEDRGSDITPEQSLRLSALNWAVDQATPHETPDEIVKRAETYLEFLSRPAAIPGPNKSWSAL